MWHTVSWLCNTELRGLILWLAGWRNKRIQGILIRVGSQYSQMFYFICYQWIIRCCWPQAFGVSLKLCFSVKVDVNKQISEWLPRWPIDFIVWDCHWNAQAQECWQESCSTYSWSSWGLERLVETSFWFNWCLTWGVSWRELACLK